LLIVFKDDEKASCDTNEYFTTDIEFQNHTVNLVGNILRWLHVE